MMTFFITMYVALLIAFGGVIGFYESFPDGDALDDDAQELEFDDTSVPTGTPGQSAPFAAIQACANKVPKDSCAFELTGKDLEGICSFSADELACTPILPE